MTDLSRERVVERIGNALAANDGSGDPAEAVYKAIQPLLSNVLWWRDQARRDRDQALSRLAAVRGLATGAPQNCGCHGEMCWPDHRCCVEVKHVDAAAILAVLDEREPVLSTQPGSDEMESGS